MHENVYKKVEVIGSSKQSMENAVENAVQRAQGSLRNLRWFEVKEIRGSIDDGKVGEWQVGLNLAFSLDAAGAEGSDSHESLNEAMDEPLVSAGRPVK